MENTMDTKAEEAYNAKYLDLLKRIEEVSAQYRFDYEAAMNGSVEGFNRCLASSSEFFDLVKELEALIAEGNKNL